MSCFTAWLLKYRASLRLNRRLAVLAKKIIDTWVPFSLMLKLSRNVFRLFFTVMKLGFLTLFDRSTMIPRSMPFSQGFSEINRTVSFWHFYAEIFLENSTFNAEDTFNVICCLLSRVIDGKLSKIFQYGTQINILSFVSVLLYFSLGFPIIFYIKFCWTFSRPLKRGSNSVPAQTQRWRMVSLLGNIFILYFR